MAHPKHKLSKQRRDKRRTHDHAAVPTLSVCPNCGATVIYHRVCPSIPLGATEADPPDTGRVRFGFLCADVSKIGKMLVEAVGLIIEIFLFHFSQFLA